MTQLNNLNPAHFLELSEIVRISVFVEHQDTMQTENCLVCGILKARPFFLVCSSYCDSEARRHSIYDLPTNTVLELDSDCVEQDWIVLELNRIRLEINYVKRAKKMYDSEKKLKLKELATTLVELEELRRIEV